jgi:hypothetical protein
MKTQKYGLKSIEIISQHGGREFWPARSDSEWINLVLYHDDAALQWLIDTGRYDIESVFDDLTVDDAVEALCRYYQSFKIIN